MQFKLPVVFDNDCISSFLWIKRLDIIEFIFPKSEIIIPEVVLDELKMLESSARFNYVYNDLKHKIDSGEYILQPISALSTEAIDYAELTRMDNPQAIGKGEAAAIVLAKSLGGTLASNNLADILPYVKGGQPPYIMTDTILYSYYKEGKITITEGNAIWNDMKRRKRRLPPYNFDEVVKRMDCNSQNHNVI
ncbi:hypothetical protein [Haloimpatiens lingqiaonensis]|uniref:hypothetical protein n=1 Tax=Haloimpatiens lingqiaonensis TaxID=1380675 RepID=UPI0010FD664C|nr:hypothetical protein [Haloimpatiens lingqiaonensis]